VFGENTFAAEGVKGGNEAAGWIVAMGEGTGEVKDLLNGEVGCFWALS